jgi:hypothetical protein
LDDELACLTRELGLYDFGDEGEEPYKHEELVYFLAGHDPLRGDAIRDMRVDKVLAWLLIAEKQGQRIRQQNEQTAEEY